MESKGGVGLQDEKVFLFLSASRCGVVMRSFMAFVFSVSVCCRAVSGPLLEAYMRGRVAMLTNEREEELERDGQRRYVVLRLIPDPLFPPNFYPLPIFALPSFDLVPLLSSTVYPLPFSTLCPFLPSALFSQPSPTTRPISATSALSKRLRSEIKTGFER
eukprot:881767-Rhodomonas_salina.2